MTQLSVSHSGDRVAVAVAPDAPVGVDVERVHASFDIGKMAKEVLAAPERFRPMRLPVRERRETFFTFWTRKKAVLKAMGGGLSVPLSGVEVSGPGEEARLLSSRHRPRRVGQVALSDLHPGPGYRAALAVLYAPPVRIRELDGSRFFRAK